MNRGRPHTRSRAINLGKERRDADAPAEAVRLREQARVERLVERGNGKSQRSGCSGGTVV